MNNRLLAKTARDIDSPPRESPATLLAQGGNAPVTRQPLEEPPTFFPKTLRLFSLVPAAAPLGAAPGATRNTGPLGTIRGAARSEDSAFSEQILNWMKQGDGLADLRAPEVVDLSDLSDPVPQQNMARQMGLARSLGRKQRVRRWLAAGVAAVVLSAAAVWATRPSATMVEPRAVAANTAGTTSTSGAKLASNTLAQPPGVGPGSSPASSTANPASTSASAAPAGSPAAGSHARRHTVAAKHRPRAHR
jgi:hypothetical protein